MSSENERLRRALRRLIQATVHPFWQRVRAAGLSMPQVFAMRYIYRHNGANISDLARALGVTPAAASQLLRRLVEQGYVVREENPADRRNKRLQLTPRGEEALQSIATPSHGTTFERLLASLSPEETEQILAALELLLAKLPSAEDEPQTMTQMAQRKSESA